MKKRLIFSALLVIICIFFVGASCKGPEEEVEEDPEVAVSIFVNPIRIELVVGETREITPSVTVSKDNVSTSVSWSSANALIATVDNVGVVTARSKGTVIITATTVVKPYLTAGAEIYVADPEGDLAEYRDLVLANLTTAFRAYDEKNYSETNFLRIEDIYETGSAKIQSALSKNIADNEYDDTISKMREVQTLKDETLAEFRLENGAVLELEILSVSLEHENAIRRAENDYNALDGDIQALLTNEITHIRLLIDRIEQLKFEKRVNDAKNVHKAAFDSLQKTDKEYSETDIELMRAAYADIFSMEYDIIKALESELALFTQYIAEYENRLLQSEIQSFKSKHAEAFALDEGDGIAEFKAIITNAISDSENLSAAAKNALQDNLNLFIKLLDDIEEEEKASAELAQAFRENNEAFIAVTENEPTAANYNSFVAPVYAACVYVSFYSDVQLAFLSNEGINPHDWFEKLALAAGLTSEDAAEIKGMRADNLGLFKTNINDIYINFDNLNDSALLQYIKTYLEYTEYAMGNAALADLLQCELNIVNNINDKITELFITQFPTFAVYEDVDDFVSMDKNERSVIKANAERLIDAITAMNSYLSAYADKYTFGADVVQNKERVLFYLELINKIETTTLGDVFEGAGEDLFFDVNLTIYLNSISEAMNLTLADIEMKQVTDDKGETVTDEYGNEIWEVTNYETIKIAFESVWTFDGLPDSAPFIFNIRGQEISFREAADYYYKTEKQSVITKLSSLMEKADDLLSQLPEIPEPPEPEEPGEG